MLDHSITRCIELLRVGDAQAAAVIWNRYFPQLVRLARRQSAHSTWRVADEEDVALNALDRFFRAAQQGRYPDLADRDSLWRLLLRITIRCAGDLTRYEHRQRRGGPVTWDGTEASRHPVHAPMPIDQIIADDPTPEFAALMVEQYRKLLERLEDPALQKLAIARMEGCANQEIAAELHCSVRTVERRLRLIREIWKQEVDDR